jgi:hypothetical protein
MAAPRNTRPSPRTFLIRRLVALALVILLIWAVWAGVSAVVGFVGNLFGGNAKPAATATATTGATAGKATTCLPKGINVMAVVGDGQKPVSSFASGVSPHFWFTITNTSDKPCYFNVGTKAQHLVVTSGSETIWDNSQCLIARNNYRLLLEPGAPQTAPAVAWERVRSSSTGCDAATKQAAAAAGFYHLQIDVNGVKSNDVQFEIK